MLRALYENYIRPLLGRPPAFQVAALCYRMQAAAPEILLITSMSTGRWILPKGWPIDGLDAPGIALEEAWEEAGIKPAEGEPRPVGEYTYVKRMTGGLPLKTVVKVFAIEVAELLDDYPEAERRKRRWATPAEAAEAVEEPSLKDLLRSLPPTIIA